MNQIYSRIRDHARQIVARFPISDFYLDHSSAYEYASTFFETDPVIKKLKYFAIKVTVEAGALMAIEGNADGYAQDFLNDRMRVVQCAGLLHDIKRKKKDHSKYGAAHARKVLENYPFSVEEVDDIYRAIHNHEAFTGNITIDTPEGALVADCLYDADKFRWGPDNFAYTLWDMISFYNPPLTEFMARYPKGMQGIARIKATFRTTTGKKYGPQFIDIGLAIGEELYDVIKAEFSDYL
jgi:hypothetical protein